MSVIDRSRIEIKLGEFGIAPATALSDAMLLPRVQDYRRQSAGRMAPLSRDDIRKKMPNTEFFVSRKIDGEFTVLIFRDGEAFTLNPGGTVRVGLPFLSEAAEQLKTAGITEAMIAGELHVARNDGKRARVHDVVSLARQPESAEDLDRLHFAVFDLISLDDAPIEQPFANVRERIDTLFNDGQRVLPVQTEVVKDARGVEEQFKKWVTEEGAEGVVARSDSAGSYKIKPQHTIDAAVIGFTESVDDREGMLHDLLLAVTRSDGALQVLCHVGGGFSDDQRRELLSDLKDLVVESEYTEVNSDHVAYQMVRPEWVVEITCLDLVSETTRGGTINRMVLDWDADAKSYKVIRRLPAVSVISPQFVRIREDKSVNPQDTRIDQLTALVNVPQADRDARAMTLPKSTIMCREVYTKVQKESTMVRKFVLWKTNKDQETDEFPAYVLHYTDFSPNRKAPLARDIRVSSSETQIMGLLEELRADNIKKGWELHSQLAAETAATTETMSPQATEVKDASKKTANKKPATAKKSTTKKKPAKKTAASDTKSTTKKTATKRKTTTVKKTTKKKTQLAESERELSATKKTTRKKKSS